MSYSQLFVWAKVNLSKKKYSCPLGREKRLVSWPRESGLLSTACKPGGPFPPPAPCCSALGLWACLALSVPLAHTVSSACRGPQVHLTQSAGTTTLTSSTAGGFLTGCHWSCWAAAATGTRGFQLGIKK